MALTPIDVQQKTFRQAFKGYDGGEVDEFLDQVVVALRDYEQRVRENEDRVAVLEDQLKNRLDSDDSIKRAFVSAQKAADELVANAKFEADGILARAREEATSLTEEQAAEQASLLAELDSLRSTTHDLAERLRSAAGREADAMSELAGEIEGSAERFGVIDMSAEPNPDDSEESNDLVEPAGERDGAGENDADPENDADGPVGPITAWTRAASADRDTAEVAYDDTPTQEVPTLRRPWERGTD